jgi:hypothetical protein
VTIQAFDFDVDGTIAEPGLPVWAGRGPPFYRMSSNWAGLREPSAKWSLLSVVGDMDRLALERLEEALGLGVVIGVAPPAHRADEAVRREQPAMRPGAVLHAAVGRRDEARGDGDAGDVRHQSWFGSCTSKPLARLGKIGPP